MPRCVPVHEVKLASHAARPRRRDDHARGPAGGDDKEEGGAAGILVASRGLATATRSTGRLPDRIRLAGQRVGFSPRKRARRRGLGQTPYAPDADVLWRLAPTHRPTGTVTAADLADAWPRARARGNHPAPPR